MQNQSVRSAFGPGCQPNAIASKTVSDKARSYGLVKGFAPIDDICWEWLIRYIDSACARLIFEARVE